MNKLSCPYHPNSVLIDSYLDGDIICVDCGRVLIERNFQDNPIDRCLLTRRQQATLHKYEEFIRDIADNRHLPECVVNDSIYFFRKYTENKRFKLNFKVISIAALCASVTYNKIGVRLESLTWFCEFNYEKQIRRLYGTMCSDFNVNGNIIEEPKPEWFVEKLVKDLGLDSREDFIVEKIAQNIISNMKISNEFDDCSAHTICAFTVFISIYLAGKVDKVKDNFIGICLHCKQVIDHVSHIGNTSKATLKKLYRRSSKYFDKIIPNTFDVKDIVNLV